MKKQIVVAILGFCSLLKKRFNSPLGNHRVKLPKLNPRATKFHRGFKVKSSKLPQTTWLKRK